MVSVRQNEITAQQNAVVKQLTLVATVFLPLTFVTGFFGQNFGWMVGHIRSSWAFFGLGIGAEIATVAILFTLFKKRGWF
jgi:magnesium transporter